MMIVQRAILSFALATCGASSLAAQEAPVQLGIELNTLDDSLSGCRLTFVVTNRLGAPLDSAIFETVLFTRDNVVERLTLFDMQALPDQRMRVRQFDVPGLACGQLGAVLINGPHACAGPDIEQDMCARSIDTSSRVSDVEVLR